MSVISTGASTYANASNLATQQSVANPVTPDANKPENLATISADNAPPSVSSVIGTLSV